MQHDHGDEARLERRQPEIGRQARQAGPDDAGDYAAGRHIGDRLGAELSRRQLDGGKAIELHVGDGVTQHQPAQAHHEKAADAQPDRRA